jgi:uncharacterized membrane protein YedE/YeeE
MNMTLPSLITPLLGGIIIGLAATLLYVTHGRVAGISGIVAGLFAPKERNDSWRWGFLLGLFVAGTGASALLQAPRALGYSTSLPLLIAAGLLVGFGARLGGGCTSGHGVCGISRFNPRSIVATTLFILAGAVAVFLARHIFGGAS